MIERERGERQRGEVMERGERQRGEVIERERGEDRGEK